MQKGLLYNMLLRLGKCFFLFPLFFIACDDLEDKPSIVPESNGDVFETGTAATPSPSTRRTTSTT